MYMIPLNDRIIEIENHGDSHMFHRVRTVIAGRKHDWPSGKNLKKNNRNDIPRSSRESRRNQTQMYQIKRDKKNQARNELNKDFINQTIITKLTKEIEHATKLEQK